MAKSGLALKFLQWFIRGVQFCCCAVVLALFSYFLATLSNHKLTIPIWARAVEGISGAGVLYTLVGLLLLCCLAGRILTSFVAIVLDVGFIGAFAYVAWANRAGASSCTGTVDSIFGTGSANTQVTSSTNGVPNLPTYREACQMHTACLAVSIGAIFFFILSILMELALVRNHRKEKRFGPGPANDYTSGYGRRGGLFGRFKRRGTTKTENSNSLPAHTTPEDVRHSYNTESTAIGHDASLNHNKYGESGYGHEGRTAYPDTGVTGHNHVAQPTNYRYADGTYNA